MTPLPLTISVIIPTLNEAFILEDAVSRLRWIPEVCEIIVADGGSTDGTPALASKLGCQVVHSPAGRGRQMQAGARMAKGDVVMLVHADTWLPPHAGGAALTVLRESKVVAGGFWKEFRDAPFLLRGCRFKNWLRLLLSGRIMGDQAMFIRREVLESIGGVPAVDLMEEFILCRSLWKVGRLKLAKATVTTSPRRFRERGVVRTYALMWSIMLRYYFGETPESLSKRYRRG